VVLNAICYPHKEHPQGKPKLGETAWKSFSYA
jgi:hypothetical protein